MQTDETPSAEPAPAEEAAAAAAMETQAEASAIELHPKQSRFFQIVSDYNLLCVCREKPPQQRH